MHFQQVVGIDSIDEKIRTMMSGNDREVMKKITTTLVDNRIRQNCC